METAKESAPASWDNHRVDAEGAGAPRKKGWACVTGAFSLRNGSFPRGLRPQRRL